MKNRFIAFVRYSRLWKQFFRHMETYFLTNSSFRLVETDFCLVATVFLYSELCWKFRNLEPYSCSWKLIFWLVEVTFLHLPGTPASESYFPSSGNVFLNKYFLLYSEEGFSVLRKPKTISSYLSYSLQVETVTEISGNQFFWGKILFLLVQRDQRDTLSSGNCFLLFLASFLWVETVTETC